MKKVLLFWVFSVLGLMGCGQGVLLNDTQISDLQVPSPDWRDQVIYFILTDRFNDGDPRNNNPGHIEYDPRYNSHYSGGDIRGIQDKLEYIQGLGVTALWITPPVANQWWDPWNHYSGYHGYWAEDFSQVDRHYGTLADYQRLSWELHQRQMYLIQDIVVNHTGNFFRYTNSYDPLNVSKNFQINTGSVPVSAPRQYPFSMNDPRDPQQRQAAVYHWTPDIDSYQDTDQILSWQMSGLDDLNTGNPVVRNALKDSFNFWIDKAGVDGFRIDTAIYVEHDFWHDFIHSPDPAHPGVSNYAAALGKKNFITFGETWVNVSPYDARGDKVAASYLGTKEKPEMSSVLNFPLHITLQSVFGEGRPTAELSYRLQNALRIYSDPYTLVNFVDNHDMNRFLAASTPQALKQALMFILTIPGIPVIYYGTEQYFTLSRAAMFKKGYGSGGKDHFDTRSEGYLFISNLIRLRKDNPLFSRGTPRILADNNNSPGVLAYTMSWEGQTALVLFNTSQEMSLLPEVDTGLPAGTRLKLLLGLYPGDEDVTTAEKGRLSLVLPPRAGMIFLAEKGSSEIKKHSGKITIRGFNDKILYTKNITLQGDSTGLKVLRLVIDGNVSRAAKFTTDSQGRWSVLLPVETLGNGSHSLAIYGKDEERNIILSGVYSFKVDIPFVLKAEQDDPVGDDTGPGGKYLYASHESFQHQMDIEKVKVYQAGNNLKISVRMAQPISTVWNPKYGFDHVSLAVYIDLPGRKGSIVMPFQNSDLPAGMEWDYLCFATGWISALYEQTSAAARNWGSPASPAPSLIVDKDNQTISILVYGAGLSNPPSLSGVRIYIATWDYDGLESSYRLLQPAPQAYIMGGGNETDALIMDDTGIITIH